MFDLLIGWIGSQTGSVGEILEMFFRLLRRFAAIRHIFADLDTSLIDSCCFALRYELRIPSHLSYSRRLASLLIYSRCVDLAESSLTRIWITLLSDRCKWLLGAAYRSRVAHC